MRRAGLEDLEQVTSMSMDLWPDAPAEEHRSEVRALLAGSPLSTMPLALFVAEDAGRLLGYVEVGLRSHADGCDPSRPCGYIEAWYVAPPYRRDGVGRQLMRAAESWVCEQGARELASDTWLDNEESQRAHDALGFHVVDRCVTYRKPLDDVDDSHAEPFYGTELARIHHEHFGMVAEAAARELLARLSRSGISSGTVVDLAAGSGILSRKAVAAGFDVRGVDLSAAMLRIAKSEAAAATFRQESLWNAELPPCVAVAAIGEAFNYAADPRASLASLEERLATIHAALAPGGILVFDIASPGRSGASGSRQAFWNLGTADLGFEEREDSSSLRLTRTITLFTPEGGLFRKVTETHDLVLYTPREVERALDRVGFAWERLNRYDTFEFPTGWHAYAARR